MVVIAYSVLHSTEKHKRCAVLCYERGKFKVQHEYLAGVKKRDASLAHVGGRGWFIAIRALCKMLSGISVLEKALPILMWVVWMQQIQFWFVCILNYSRPSISFFPCSSFPCSLGKQLTSLLPSLRKDINAEKVKWAALWVGMLWNLPSLASVGGHQEFN